LVIDAEVLQDKEQQGVERIFSVDRAFDGIPGVTRIR